MTKSQTIILNGYHPSTKVTDEYYKKVYLQHYKGNLGNTEFVINIVGDVSIEKYDAEISINSIDKANFLFLSISREESEFSIVKEQLMTVNSCLKFKFAYVPKIQVDIKSFKDWLNEQYVLTDDCEYSSLIENDYMINSSDIDIRTSSDDFEEKIKAHSVILCSKSKYFLKLFESDLKESQTKTIDLEISKESLIPILQYIYTGEMNKKFFVLDNYSNILEIYEKVCEYELNKLKPMLQVFILGYLNANNLKLLMKSGILLQNDDFTEKAMSFIVNCFNY